MWILQGCRWLGRGGVGRARGLYPVCGELGVMGSDVVVSEGEVVKCCGFDNS
jgi:hypothetical protein